MGLEAAFQTVSTEDDASERPMRRVAQRVENNKMAKDNSKTHNKMGKVNPEGKGSNNQTEGVDLAITERMAQITQCPRNGKTMAFGEVAEQSDKHRRRHPTSKSSTT